MATFTRVAAVLKSSRGTHTAHSTRSLATASPPRVQSKTIVIPDTNGANGTVNLIYSQPSQTRFNPPLVMLTGTGQSCETYNAHVRSLSDKLGRPVYCIDLRGQGKTTLK